MLALNATADSVGSTVLTLKIFGDEPNAFVPNSRKKSGVPTKIVDWETGSKIGVSKPL